MALEKNKKRKYRDENRLFNPKWEHDYAFTVHENKPLCLICHKSLCQNKGSNVKRHYETMHKNFINDFPLTSEARKLKLAELKTFLKSEPEFMKASKESAEEVKSKKERKDSDVTAQASFVLSWNLARAKHPYSDCDFVKKNIADVVAVLEPNNKNLQRLIAEIPGSRRTAQRRISQISADVQLAMQKDLKNSLAFSLALDEWTGVQEDPQLAVFVRYVSYDMTVKEELLELLTLKETTLGIDIKNALYAALTIAHAPFDKLVSVAANGAPTMMDTHGSLIELMKSDSKFPPFLPVYCIIHHEHLVAKHFKYEEVVKTVLEVVNFIRVNGKSNTQFQNLLEDLEDAPNATDASLRSIVRWLSASNVLNRFVDSVRPISIFLEEKGKSYPQLKSKEWMQDLFFLTDVMKHLQTLDCALQGANNVVSDLAQTVFSFQNKVRVFQRDIMSKTFCHFPNLRMRMNDFPEEVITDQKVKEYKEKFQGLLGECKARFDDLQELRPCFTFLTNPFNIDVTSDDSPVRKPFFTDTAAAEMELIELQADLVLKSFHQSYSAVEFWKLVPENKYPELKKASAQLLSVFGSTHCCESWFSVMKFVKSKFRTTLTGEHLKELIRTALTTYCPDFQRLTNGLQTHKSCIGDTRLW